MCKTKFRLYFVILCSIIQLNYICAKEPTALRLEGQYTAHYQYAGELSSGNYTIEGNVVYYIFNPGDNKARITCDVYPERVIDNTTDTIARLYPAALSCIQEVLWPHPINEEDVAPVRKETTDNCTTMVYDLKTTRDSAHAKAQRLFGYNQDIDSAICTITYHGDEPFTPDHISKMSSSWSGTLNGRIYRWQLGDKPSHVDAQICITLDPHGTTDTMTCKEAKKLRKREQRLWKDSRK